MTDILIWLVYVLICNDINRANKCNVCMCVGSWQYMFGSAPQIITDVKKLPPRPSPVLCPYCQQYIITEISMVPGNTAWMVCLLCSFLWWVWLYCQILSSHSIDWLFTEANVSVCYFEVSVKGKCHVFMDILWWALFNWDRVWSTFKHIGLFKHLIPHPSRAGLQMRFF